MLTASFFEEQPQIWDGDSGRPAGKMQALPRRESFASVACASNGMLATGTWKWRIIVWDACQRVLLREVSPFSQPVVNIAFSDDGQILAAAETTGSWYAPRVVRVYDTKTFDVRCSLRQSRRDAGGSGSDTTCLKIVGEDYVVVTGHKDGMLRVWRCR